MSKRVLILVEGHTEERFVKTVLAPHFYEMELFFSPTILVTKRVKDGANFKGGVTNFLKFKNDLLRLLGGSGGALVTTLLDYYALPLDFPGMDSRPIHGPASQKISHVESALKAHFNAPNFSPFLALHEFEAWLFSSPNELPSAMLQPEKQQQFQTICNSVATPEDINEGPESAPSKRILALFPAYQKVVHGPTVSARIGVQQIRDRCPHFNQWISHMEMFAKKPFST